MVGPALLTRVISEPHALLVETQLQVLLNFTKIGLGFEDSHLYLPNLKWSPMEAHSKVGSTMLRIFSKSEGYLLFLVVPSGNSSTPYIEVLNVLSTSKVKTSRTSATWEEVVGGMEITRGISVGGTGCSPAVLYTAAEHGLASYLEETV